MRRTPRSGISVFAGVFPHPIRPHVHIQVPVSWRPLASKDLDRFLPLLGTYDHAKAVPLYDSLIRDPANAAAILQELVYVISKQDDPQLRTPHGLATAMAARSLLHFTKPPAGLGLLRFLVLYNFGVRKSPVSPEVLRAAARGVPAASLEESSSAYRKAVSKGLGDQAGILLCRISLDHGHEVAAHVALRTALDDIGRLGHNLITATAYMEAAHTVGPPRDLVPLSRLAHIQSVVLSDTPVAAIPEREGAGKSEPDVELLGDLVVEGAFDRVEGVLQALAFEGQADRAYRPLLIAASQDPGFLGHTLEIVHHARLASRILTPSENTFLLWKLYRVLTTRFGYPEFLQPGAPSPMEKEAVLAALESSLTHKSPPAEATVRQALECGVPLEEILAKIVNFYGNWTVGEKEHTISYLNAALRTAEFLGKDEALLPLAIALGKLPF